jgi:hypothetical protein
MPAKLPHPILGPSRAGALRRTAPLSAQQKLPLTRPDTNDASHRPASGGGERIRTDDLLLAKQALSQLSYTPRPNASGVRVGRAPVAPLSLSKGAPQEPAPCGLASVACWSLFLRRAALAVAAQPLTRPATMRFAHCAPVAAPHERRCASFGGGPGRI